MGKLCPSLPASGINPETPVPYLSPKDAGRVMKRARSLLAAGKLSGNTLTLLDALMFNCRRPGQPSVRASLSLLQRLTHLARHTVLAGLSALEATGLIVRRKHRLRVPWSGGVASRQDVNEYAICTECSACTVSTESEVSKRLTRGWTRGLRPLLPIRSVDEQLALLLAG